MSDWEIEKRLENAKDAEIARLKALITELVNTWYSEPQQYRGDSIVELLERARAASAK